MTIVQFTVPAEPANEAVRLAAVAAYGLDRAGLPADPELDRIVEAAAARFSVPIVLVSIVTDSQQCFRACRGLDVDATPRSISFCGHAIHGSTPFVVCDTLQDDRFSGNPLVIGPPHIRFYAGAPLISPDGLAIGTFCVIDTTRREFYDDDSATLAGFAEAVISRLELLRP